MPDAITMGEALIDFIPGQVGRALADVTDFKRAAGGAPFNVAVGLARLGVDVGFMGKLGDDVFGRFLQKVLMENGVNIEQLVFTREALTTLAFVSLKEDGERDFIFYRKPGADMQYRADEIDFGYVNKAKVFHFGSISLIDEPVRTPTRLLVEYARSKGLLVTFDPNIRLALWGSVERAMAEIKEIVPYVDLIKLNEEELETLTGIGREELNENVLAEAARQIFELGPHFVVVTLGKKGSYLYSRACRCLVAGYEFKAIDTTGAGDAFMAALLSQIYCKTIIELEKISINEWQKILSFANWIGGMST
ncbi:MAG: carbohydrate kinase, partial [Firmicutes bacterium]|nr:carbohydrate kinase [Bacillota bacterium]